MTVFVNGQPIEATENETIDSLIAHLGLPAETALVEHNGVALRRRDWPQERLKTNDRLEILRVAAGG